MQEGVIEQFLHAVVPGEVVKQTPVAEEEQKPLRQLSEEKTRAPEVEYIPYEEMTSYQLYGLLLEGKLPPSAVLLYFQKQKQEDLDRARGTIYKRSYPINSVERKHAHILAAQHAKIVAKNYSDPQKIAREVVEIEARYEPLINGTPQDHARYFANQAIDLSLNHKWEKPEDITRVNIWVANLYGLASRLSREVVVGQATPAGKSNAVVAASKPQGQPAA